MKTIFSILAIVAINITAIAHGADLTLNFQTNINGNALQFNTEYTVGGAKIQANFLGYYITDIKLVKTDDTEKAISGIYLVKGNETLTFEETADAGDYKAIKFNVGIADSLTNHGDPSLQPSGSPLSLQSPSMHWSWNTGYIFFRLDGLVDTSSNNQHGLTESLTFHLGRLSSVRTVTINENFTITGTHDNPGKYAADITLNVEAVFAGIDLKTDRVTMTMNNPTLATEACDNLPGAFEFSFRTTTGIAERNSFQNSVKVFPNPADNMITIVAETMENNTVLYVTDVAGKIVAETTVTDNKTQVNITNFERGVYFVKSATQSGSARFIKM
jgi:hypothetical protein